MCTHAYRNFPKAALTTCRLGIYKLLLGLEYKRCYDCANLVPQLVLTGGPCGGKTTGQARLATFFENLGWKGEKSF